MKSEIFLKYISFFYIFAVALLIFGLLGIALGMYVQLFRPSSPGELMLNRSLFLYSIGIVFSALVHFGAFKTIRRLSEDK
jgi:hypothetical protein